MGIHIIHIKNPILREIFSYVKIIVVAFLLVFILNHFIIANVNVPTGSMKNTIMENDRLIGFRLSYLFSSPERGDIIIFKYPDNESINYVTKDKILAKALFKYYNGDKHSITFQTF